MLRNKILVLMLLIMISLGNSQIITFAETPIYVLAATDFQPKGGETEEENLAIGLANVSSIIDKMKDVGGYNTFDGFLFCGDYSNGYRADYSSAGLAALDNLIMSKYPQCQNRFYVQGNHDSADMTGLSQSGANDTENYGVYVIHEDDFPHNVSVSSALNATQKTADALKTYLKDKIQAEYKKPIFIISHLPLHYNSRTVEKNNAVGGDLLFNVIDDAAEYGLNIVYMFGHNHSGSYDSYLGDYAIYLEPGDEITIAQSSVSEIMVESLDFIYMNAGYVGYYNNVGNKALTMTAFKIENDKITVERYNNSGKYSLKEEGKNVGIISGISVNSKVYESPRVVKMNNSQKEWKVEWKYATDSGYYSEEGEFQGIVRFLFSADNSRGKIKETGVVYVDSDGNEVARSSTGTADVFYADVIDISMESQVRYYAKAYSTLVSRIYDDEEKTIWSDIIECDVNKSKFVTLTK